MTKYRHNLPQLRDQLFLSDGGLETTLIFHQRIDLPHFASFDLLRDMSGRETIRQYFLPYLEAARRTGYGFILESPTWRANPDWGSKLGYSREALTAVNRDAIELMLELREAFEAPSMPIVVSGCIGPRGDGYVAGDLMSAEEAAAYHAHQISVFAKCGADMVAAYTMTNTPEALGIVRAAHELAIPVAISFTLETDGSLPSGESLSSAIDTIDAETARAPAYYMINCAHPTHFASTLAEGGAWIDRLLGIRANASRRNHAELNEAQDLDDGNPEELGAQYRNLLRQLPHIRVLGGCCGTDHRHVACIGEACQAA